MTMRENKVTTVALQWKPNSCEFFKLNWTGLKILGVPYMSNDSGHGFTYLYILYSIILNIMVSICYPLHLSMELFRSDLMGDNIKNFAVCLTCTACSIKFMIFASKISMIRRFEEILKTLDVRLKTEEERVYFGKLKNRLRNIGLVFMMAYFPIGITAELSFIFREERSLLYPGKFPFNWMESSGLFFLANVYQIVGVFFLILQNYVDDAFAAMALCLLGGHLQMLTMRISNIGYDEKSLQDNEEELDRCVEDQQMLYELSDTIENIISWPMFIQFCVTATNICVAMAALIFYASAPLDILYYAVYFTAMSIQIFPACYYGSIFTILFDQLHHAVYASNWTSQSRKYKKHMILFTERSLKKNIAVAGGMLKIHLDTFFSTCRGAYSLFTIIMRMK